MFGKNKKNVDRRAIVIQALESQLEAGKISPADYDRLIRLQTESRIERDYASNNDAVWGSRKSLRSQ